MSDQPPVVAMYPLKDGTLTLQGARGKFVGRLPAPRPAAPPTEQRCTKCKKVWPIAHFHVQRTNVTGRGYWCKACKAESMRLAREGARLAQGNLARMKGKTLLAKVRRLVEAAHLARSFGMWRGREAVRAYAQLGAALEAIGVPAQPEADSVNPAFREEDRAAELQPPDPFTITAPLFEEEP